MSAELAFAAIWLSVLLYAVLGGADFGAGVWDAVTRMRLPAAERELLFRAIGPVWEANHVWLVFAGVLTFTAFPAAFAALSQALWAPFLVALVGIVFRGSAFVFRAHGPDPTPGARGWSAAFGLASTATPLAFGASAGAVAAGRFGGEGVAWLRPLPIVCALLAVASCAYLAAVFLVREGWAAKSDALVAAWRRRAYGAAVVAGVLAVAGLAVMALDEPAFWRRFVDRSAAAIPLSGLAAAGSVFALSRGRFLLADAAAAAAVGLVLLGAGAAMYPNLVAPELAPRDRVDPAVLSAMLWSVGLGALAVVPSLLFLLRLFKTAGRKA
jgi:cytochrome d ubiquinol oxidase subunit II